MSDVTVQDVFKCFYIAYGLNHSLSDVQNRTMNCILNCKTGECGMNVSECLACGKKFIHYNSCKNRNCPMCQWMDVEEWVDKQKENVLDCPYFHAVFTVPSEMYSLIYANQKLLYDALYHAVHKTLSELSQDKKHLGAKIGYICVLHTWGTKLNYHPHLHTIVLGGGLTAANKWKDKGTKFFLPVKVLSKVFRKYYLNELKELKDNQKLSFSGDSEKLKNSFEWKEFLDKLYKKEWVVYEKEAFNGACSVIKYLGKYTHRSAISNSRIQSIDVENVCFLVKNYNNNSKYEPYTIAGEEFIRRFLMHVLPKGFVRIRHYGILACRCKREKMDICRKLLGCKKYTSLLRNKTTAEKLKILYNKDITVCSECGGDLNTHRETGRYMLC